MNPPFSKTPSFKDVGLTTPMTEFGLSLVAFKDEQWRPSGTAVIIGPHLAITAKHVITDFWNSYESTALVRDSRGTFCITAFQVLDQGRRGNLWTITKIYLSPFTDVAFLSLQPYSADAVNHSWRGVRLNVLPPVVGSRIVGFGYHSSKISLGVETPEQITVEWFDSPATTVGEVIEIHHKQRDSSMLPFPCFQTNARFEHGMSGGPVFNESGELCGLICSGFPPDDNTYTSYAVSIWPALGTELDLPYEGFLRGAKYSCLELARRNIITANGWERVNLESPTRVSLRQPFSLSAVLQKAVENPS